jgi:GGDEF domain-containing protein
MRSKRRGIFRDVPRGPRAFVESRMTESSESHPDPSHAHVGDAAGRRVEAALRRHLERSDPGTGLANRLVLVELLRTLSAPPTPHELVAGVIVVTEEVLRPGTLGRVADRSAVLAEFGRFIGEAAPEGAVATAIADGVVLIALPGRSAPRAQAVAARLRALWLRRAWSLRGIGRPTLSVQVKPIPASAYSGGWLDRLVEECRSTANGPRVFRHAA